MTIANLLKDPNGQNSSKRVIAGGAFVALVGFGAALFAGCKPDPDLARELFRDLMLIGGYGLAGAAFDHFAPRRPAPKPDDDDKPEDEK